MVFEITKCLTESGRTSTAGILQNPTLTMKETERDVTGGLCARHLRDNGRLLFTDRPSQIAGGRRPHGVCVFLPHFTSALRPYLIRDTDTRKHSL